MEGPGETGREINSRSTGNTVQADGTPDCCISCVDLWRVEKGID